MTAATHVGPAARARPDDELDRRAGRWQRAGRWTVRALAVAGALLLVALVTGAVVDLLRVDPTSGGYEPPYTDYRGDSINWDARAYDTPTGMVATGHVLDVHVDCTTGMISVEALGTFSFDYRELSERALAVHEPRQACEERGFAPAF